MGKLERITADVPAEMAQGMRAAIEGGAYPSTDALVMDALAQWLGGARPGELNRDDLRALISEGAKGEAVDADAFFDQLDAEISDLKQSSEKAE